MAASIRVDDRTGSKELVKHFQAYGIAPEVTRLEFGDLDFSGCGPVGRCSVVIERKRIDDLTQSMTSHRLSGHQLPGMCRLHDYGYLIVEGIWRPSKDGEIEIAQGPGRWIRRRMRADAVMNYVMGLALRAGMIPWRTGSQEETVAFAVAQYKSWQKPWAEHDSHEAVYAPADAGGGRGFMLSFQPRAVPLVEKLLLQLPGLDKKARDIAKAIGSGRQLGKLMHMGLWEDWATLPWTDKNGKLKKLGEAGKKIVEALEERV